MSEDQHRKIRSFVRREGRRNLIESELWDRLWGRFGFGLDQEKPDFASLFANSNPMVLEIGFGDGANTLAQAKRNPELNFIGVEVYRTGTLKLMRELDEKSISNVKVCCDDVIEVLQDYIPDNALDKILVFFPDPWQKKRHHKRRLLQAKFFNLIWKKLKSNGEIYLATDWANYAESIEEELTKVKALFTKGNLYGNRSPYRIETKFEKRAIVEGRDIFEFHLAPIAK